LTVAPTYQRIGVNQAAVVIPRQAEVKMDRSGGYQEHPFVAEFYDYVVPYRERRDLDFWVEMAQESGGPVLEMGCGTGRVLIRIARAGVGITGLDLSGRMLDLCREHLSRETRDVQQRVQLVQADMAHFSLGRQFALVTAPFRSFQHLLEVEEQVSCLECAHRHLAPGGRLVLDVFNPSMPQLVEERYLHEYGEEPEFQMPDGRRIVRRNRVVSRDYFNQTIEGEFIYQIAHPDGRQERKLQRFQMRYLFKYEMEHLLARCGFSVSQVFADFKKSPYGSQYPGDLIFVARKI
jgi:SAM-dependent methyltransferase